MTPVTAGDQRGHGRDNVCRIEASSHPGFPNDQVTGLFPEPLESHDSYQLEESGLIFDWDSAAQVCRSGTKPRHIGFRNQHPVDLDALPEADEVGRSVEASFQPGLTVNALEKGAG